MASVLVLVVAPLLDRPRVVDVDYTLGRVRQGLPRIATTADPYQLGFIGGTDNHNGLPSDVAEEDYIGSHGPADGTLKERREGEIDGWIKSKESNPGSLAAVWATRNTRAAVWDAMAARETFVTSGTRIKGMVDANGEPQDKVIDVVWSGDRKPDANGKLPPVGKTVDLKTATYANTIGSPELMGTWTDPDFKPNQHALYYVRVLEIPTPRWTTYDAVRNKLALLPDVESAIQERAWSSPIWYKPG